MTDYDFILNTSFKYFRDNHIYNGQSLRKINPQLSRDPRLIRFWVDNCDRVYIRILIGNTKITLSSSFRAVKKHKLPIFSFKTLYSPEEIKYMVLVANQGEFKKTVKTLEESYNNLFADLHLVSQYMTEDNFIETFNKVTGFHLDQKKLSIHFERLVDLCRMSIRKPNNYEELIKLTYNFKNEEENNRV